MPPNEATATLEKPEEQVADEQESQTQQEDQAEEIQVRPAPRVVSVRYSCKYYFTDDERLEISSEMANASHDLAAAEDDLKQVKSQFKARTDGYEATIRSCSENIRSGYEMRSLPCKQVFDVKKGVTEVVRDDTGDVVFSRGLSESEVQYEFELDARRDPEPLADEGQEEAPAEGGIAAFNVYTKDKDADDSEAVLFKQYALAIGETVRTYGDDITYSGDPGSFAQRVIAAYNELQNQNANQEPQYLKLVRVDMLQPGGAEEK